MIDLIDSIALRIAKRDRERLEGPLQRCSVQAAPLREPQPGRAVSSSNAAFERLRVACAGGAKGVVKRRELLRAATNRGLRAAIAGRSPSITSH